MSDAEIKNIYRWMKSIYPFKKDLPAISDIHTINDLISLKLSHFTIVNGFTIGKYIPINNAQTLKIHDKWMTVNTYMKMIVNTIEYRYLSFFLENPTYIPVCNLPSLHIKEVCQNRHIYKPHYTNLVSLAPPIPQGANHFIFPSLDLRTDSKRIKRELDRLITTRNDHKTLHFHLNEGGDLDVVHSILRCLCEKKEAWMKPLVVYDMMYNHEDDITHKKTIIPQEHDPWQDFLYKDKYSGKIVLHVNLHCASSAWYLITYLIYAFSNTIVRETVKLYGKTIKVGRVTGNIKIHGYSSTTSGDALGEEKDIQKTFTIFDKPFTIRAPSQVYITSVQKQDYNRFWLPN